MQRDPIVACVSLILIVLAATLPGFSTPNVSDDALTSVERIGCAMFPESSLRFPVGHTLAGSHTPSGISEATFNDVIDTVERVYSPVVRAAGAKLIFIRDWENAKVNANADRDEKMRSWYIHMYGGLARHPLMTADRFLALTCHEVGHHLGGLPNEVGEWASSESQADDFALRECLRAVVVPSAFS